MEPFKSATLVAAEEGKLTNTEKGNPLRNCGKGNSTCTVSRATLIRGFLILSLFNLGLIILLAVGYIYLNSLSVTQQRSFMNASCIVGGIATIIVLFQMGDLSRDKPNFYYI